MDDENKVMTVEELAKELRISINLAYRQVREGRIYSIKCGVNNRRHLRDGSSDSDKRYDILVCIESS